jgi:hypothetical protein
MEICEGSYLALLGMSKTTQLKKIQARLKNPNQYVPPPEMKNAFKKDHARTYIQGFMTYSCECCPSGDGDEETNVKVMHIFLLYIFLYFFILLFLQIFPFNNVTSLHKEYIASNSCYLGNPSRKCASIKVFQSAYKELSKNGKVCRFMRGKGNECD